MSRLFSLFDDRLKKQSDLVAHPAQSLETIFPDDDGQDNLLRKIKLFEKVTLKVDYSDFANFVFFNSALDYFNITGEKILNELPYDQSENSRQMFSDSLDDYQRYALSMWPARIGHLNFTPSSGFAYVNIADVGTEAKVARTTLLSPGTGSWAIEMWAVPPPALTGSNDAMVVLQKVSGSNMDGYSVYFSGSKAFFKFSSGSTSSEVSASAVPGVSSYFAYSFDKDGLLATVMTGSRTSFPIVVMSATHAITGIINVGGSKLNIGSGTLASKTVIPLSGCLDDIRLWNTTRVLSTVTSSFNTKIFAQSGLVALWRFNETGSTNFPVENAVVLDYAGHRLNGNIQNYYTSLRRSGSLLSFDYPDQIMSYNAPEVYSHVSDQQTSGTLYDRDNDNLIMRFFPENFALLEDFNNTTILRDFLYMIARELDQVKVGIDQFTNVLKVNYGEFNQTPDALLQDAARFFGWEFTGNFLNADAVQYLVGKNVLTNLDANKELDNKLYQIKNEFWKRTLLNLMYMYKSKGTRESVEALFRVYGVNKNFVRLKEYGAKKNTGISTFRINAQKSSAALTFGSGSVMTSNRVNINAFTSSLGTVEIRARFPNQISTGLTASIGTGSLWTINSGSMRYQLNFAKDSFTSQTGSLILTGSEGSLILSGASIFDNRWYNIAFVRSSQSSSLNLEVRSLDGDAIDRHLYTSGTFTVSPTPRIYTAYIGSTTGGVIPSQQWVQEFRVWQQALTSAELDDHTLNYQSFGIATPNDGMLLNLHLRLNENSTFVGGSLVGGINDVSGRGISGSALGFTADENPYKKFLNDYNYIASPEYGWNDDKVRVLDESRVTPDEAFDDLNTVALEFNMIDALNEDISQIVSTLDGFNEAIGIGANRYRESYPDLEILRRNYFKRLQGRLNFRVFADMLEFFDRSFIDLTRRLMPARVNFIGEEFIVESHMLERPKLQWNYRRQEQQLQLEGAIRVFIR